MALSRSRAALLAAVVVTAAAAAAPAVAAPARAHTAGAHARGHHTSHRHGARRHARPQVRPSVVALRLGQVNRQDTLFAPGLAMASVQRYLGPGAPITLPSDPLRRPVTLVGRPVLRLHLSHALPGDLTLAVGLEAVAPSGDVRTLLNPVVNTIPAAVLDRGPKADADLRLPAVAGSLVAGERLELTLSEPAASGSADWVTFYFGALPGEDTNPNDLNQQADAAKGGHDPARLILRAYGRGPFQSW